jgi:hypothetical protein
MGSQGLQSLGPVPNTICPPFRRTQKQDSFEDLVFIELDFVPSE